MGGRHLLHVYNSSHAYRMKRLTAYIPMSVKRYSEGKKVHEDHEQHVHEERAPSTAEEFIRLAEEKSHRDAAPSDHHLAEEEEEGSEETSTTTSDSDVESVGGKILNEPSSIGPTS